MEDCKHECGTYIDKEDLSHEVDVIRCNNCDACLNMTDKEFEGDLYDSDFWDDNDEDF